MNNEYVDHNNTDPVRALIAEWRESAADTQRYSASDYADGYAAAKSYCANRLEAALASAPVGVEDLPGDLRWKLEKLRPGSSGVVTLNRAEWDYVRAALSQQPAAPSGTRNFREILAEREAQSPGITAKIEERTAELVAAPQQPVGVDGLLADLETIWHSVSDDKETNAAYERLKIALAQQPAPSAPVGVEAVRGAWLAAITLANNICVQESDRENDRDGDTAWIDGTAKCAKRIREYAHPTDAELLEMLDEAGANAAKAALAQQPAASSAPVGVEDDPIDASDNAEYIEHCADRLERCGLRVTAGALRVIAHEHRALALAEQQHTSLQAENERLLAEVSGLRAARIAYANEFPATEDGDPDTGNIHANIRALKVHAERLRAEVDKWQALCEALTAALSSAEKSIERTRSLESAMADLIEAATELRARQRDYLSQPKGERVEQKGRLVGEAAARLDAALARVQGGRADG